MVRGDGTRRDGKGQGKHRANAAAIINEAFEIADPADGHAIPIRKSASETYDRSRTINNKYTGHQTANDVLKALEGEADQQQVEVKVTDRETGEPVVRKRALASNAVIGVAVIYKPPCEIAKGWPKEKYDRFIRDSKEVMASLPCGKMNKKGEIIGEKFYLFREENIIASAEHHDEGARSCPDTVELHEHDIYIPKDQHGKYNGHLIDALFLSAVVNRNYPRMMRERGWDIDDCDVTDWELFAKDEGYRTRRRTKIRQGGKPVNNYVADKNRKEAEAVLAEARELVEKTAVSCREAVAQAKTEAAAIREEARADAERIDREKEQAEADRDQAEQEAKTARDRIEAEARAAWDAWLDRKKKQVNNAGNKIIADARAKAAELTAEAAEAAEGEYAFLLKWMGKQKYKTGETLLEVAQKAHLLEIHKKRVSALPPSVRDTGKGQQADQDGPTKP